MNDTFWHTENPRALLQQLGNRLYQWEPHNNVPLGVAEAAGRNGQRFLAIASANAEIAPFVAVMTPPKNVAIAYTGEGMSEAEAEAAGRWMRKQAYTAPGVLGPCAVARAFATGWIGHDPGDARSHTRIHSLAAVAYAGHGDGTFRSAREAELPQLIGWLQGFQRDGGMDVASDEEAATLLAPRIATGDVYLLVLDVPVSMATRVRSTREVDAIGYVYTPAEYRNRGHATALVARLSQRLLDAGKRATCLYTDLANPVSNAIYARIGYKPAMDADLYTWDAAPARH